MPTTPPSEVASSGSSPTDTLPDGTTRTTLGDGPGPGPAAGTVPDPSSVEAASQNHPAAAPVAAGDAVASSTTTGIPRRHHAIQ